MSKMLTRLLRAYLMRCTNNLPNISLCAIVHIAGEFLSKVSPLLLCRFSLSGKTILSTGRCEFESYNRHMHGFTVY